MSSPAPVPAEDALVVLVTAPNMDVAASLARSLVEARLAACGNLVPGIRSIYAWDGKICDDAEVLLVLKTRRASLDALTAAVVAQHPYDCPEVLAIDVAGGHGPYLSWIAQNVG